MAAGLPRSGVVMPGPGSGSGGKAGELGPHRFPLSALPLQTDVRAAAADSILLAVAYLISYWLAIRVLTPVYSVSADDDALGGMRAVIATVFLFRDSYNKSLAAGGPGQGRVRGTVRPGRHPARADPRRYGRPSGPILIRARPCQ